jgi:hypothetical protein
MVAVEDDTQGNPDQAKLDALAAALAAKQGQEYGTGLMDSSRRAFGLPDKGVAVGMGLAKGLLGAGVQKKAREKSLEAERATLDAEVLEEKKARQEVMALLMNRDPDMDEETASILARNIVADRLKMENVIAKPGEGPKLTDINALQTQISKASAPMRARSENIRDVYSYAQQETAFGDHAAIFGYLKLLDPTSTVREGEFATVENSGSWPQIWVGRYNRALKGEKLTPEQRDQLLDAVTSTYQAYVDEHPKTMAPYKKRAEHGNIPLDILDFYEPWLPPEKESPPEAAVEELPAGYELYQDENDNWLAREKTDG